MIDELNAAIESYHAKWHALVAGRKDRAFFQKLRPTAVAWKAVDRTDFDTRFSLLRDHAEQIHMAWMNGRWLATFYLRDELPTCELRVVKLMERRPGSSDATGLDHLDFLITQGDAKQVLSAEVDLKWTEEKNGDHCKWISLWFGGTEAKLRNNTVLQICAEELIAAHKDLLT